MTRRTLPDALDTTLLTETELRAAALDGELAACGPAWLPVDSPWDARHRARSLATALPKRLIAERRTAAWVYGALPDTPDPHELCSAIDSRASRAARALPFRALVREVVFEHGDVMRFHSLAITTPERTACDLARFEEHDDEALALLAALARVSPVDLDRCARLVRERGRLAWKTRALDRLRGAREAQLALMR